MSKFKQWSSNATKSVLGVEAHLFLAYAFITFRPGATPPLLPAGNTPQPKPVPADWTDDERSIFIEESRLDVAAQQADKRDIRARAQITLTTAIVLGGTWVNSLSARNDLCGRGMVLYGLAGLALASSVLASGGIISARSPIGTVSVIALTHYEKGEIHQKVAEGYATTRLVGARTIATLVTVLRDCVLALVLGAILLAVAHLT
ncbi:hypothetical protein GCM10022234_22500 [Aeromicrobium panaciterrae]|uniref:hypothetical protein n=1 Tax=Aeromicrobium panaciterrae TaxID=363861 RepID=UPI0031DEC236